MYNAPVSISLGGQTGRLENLPRLFFIFVEEVAQIGNHGDISLQDDRTG